MPTYVVASDLSVRSDRAVQRAFDLAARNGARLVILSVIDESLPSDIAARLKADAEAQLRETAQTLAATRKAEWEVVVATGDPVATIAETVALMSPDLLILGIHRTRPFLDDFRDTTMQLIVRLGLCPTLLVRDPADHPYRTVLAAVDFSPAAAAAVRAARTLVPDAKIEAVHAVHIPFRGLLADTAGATDGFISDARQDCDAWGAAEGIGDIAAACKIVPGGVRQVVSAAIQAQRPDLLVLGAHARSMIASMVLGSFVAELIRDPGLDLLVAQPARR